MDNPQFFYFVGYCGVYTFLYRIRIEQRMNRGLGWKKDIR